MWQGCDRMCDDELMISSKLDTALVTSLNHWHQSHSDHSDTTSVTASEDFTVMERWVKWIWQIKKRIFLAVQFIVSYVVFIFWQYNENNVCCKFISNENRQLLKASSCLFCVFHTNFNIIKIVFWSCWCKLLWLQKCWQICPNCLCKGHIIWTLF